MKITDKNLFTSKFMLMSICFKSTTCKTSQPEIFSKKHLAIFSEQDFQFLTIFVRYSSDVAKLQIFCTSGRDLVPLMLSTKIQY